LCKSQKRVATDQGHCQRFDTDKKQGLNGKQEKGRNKQGILIVLNDRDGEI